MHLAPAREPRLPPSSGCVRLRQELRGIGADFRAAEQAARRLVECQNEAARIDYESSIFRGIQGSLQTEHLGRILNRERINKTIEGVYFICIDCKKVCHNMDDGLIEDPNNAQNLCGACAKSKGKDGKGKTAAA